MTRAKALAVLGTGSNVGKTVVTAGLCRLLRRAGLSVAPFKAQNMSLNSFVTPEGGEIGRAQALQAEACGIPPHTDMNPILLKPMSDCRSQVVLQGHVHGTLDARTYFSRTQDSALAQAVRESYDRLASAYEVIVLEGAGSAAEVNLRDRDLVNWSAVEMADAQVVLVADIDRGGVFAQLVGTLDLITPQERARVCGLLINKFRGDAALFVDGVRFLAERTGIPVLGVLPFLRDLSLDQEDGLEVERRRQAPFTPETVNLAVVLLPHMSNFTDFNAPASEPDVRLRYIASPEEAQGADAIILPGSKTTLDDLEYLRAQGFEPLLQAHVRQGGEVIGICGGYQILGRTIADPDGVESGGTGRGFGLLDVTTVLAREKVTAQVIARPLQFEETAPWSVTGYVIHMGRTERHGDRPCFALTSSSPSGEVGATDDDRLELDGAMRADGLVWGTYLHGLFDQPAFRRAWLNRIRRRKHLPPRDLSDSAAVNAARQGTIDRWADHLTQHLDLAPIRQALGLQ